MLCPVSMYHRLFAVALAHLYSKCSKCFLLAAVGRLRAGLLQGLCRLILCLHSSRCSSKLGPAVAAFQQQNAAVVQLLSCRACGSSVQRIMLHGATTSRRLKPIALGRSVRVAASVAYDMLHRYVRLSFQLKAHTLEGSVFAVDHTELHACNMHCSSGLELAVYILKQGLLLSKQSGLCSGAAVQLTGQSTCC